MERIYKTRTFFFLIIMIFLFGSCNTGVGRTKKPNNLISQAVMAEVLADIHIAEASIQMENSEDDSIRQTYVNYYYAVFEKHNISKEAFVASMDYYIKNPETLQLIYDNVSEILSTKRGVKM